jgi:hypothetical protein
VAGKNVIFGSKKPKSDRLLGRLTLLQSRIVLARVRNPPIFLLSIILSDLCATICQNRHIPSVDAIRPFSESFRHADS